MDNIVIAKPGDKIVVIDRALSKYSDQEWVVLEPPPCSMLGLRDSNLVWIGPESGPNWPTHNVRVFLYSHQYELVTHMKSTDPLSGANRRRDDNLRSVFG
jgi:hypothetical protein